MRLARWQGALAVVVFSSIVQRTLARLVHGHSRPSLFELGSLYDSHKITFHRYDLTYERVFERVRDQPLRLLEIGALTGASAKMWCVPRLHRPSLLPRAVFFLSTSQHIRYGCGRVLGPPLPWRTQVRLFPQGGDPPGGHQPGRRRAVLGAPHLPPGRPGVGQRLGADRAGDPRVAGARGSTGRTFPRLRH